MQISTTVTYSLSEIEKELNRTIEKIKREFDEAKLNYSKIDSEEKVLSAIEVFEKYLPLLTSMEKEIQKGYFNYSKDLMQSATFNHCIKEIFKKTHPILELAEFSNLPFSNDIIHLDSLLENYQAGLQIYNFEILESRLRELKSRDDSLSQGIQMSCIEEMHLQEELKHLTPHVTSHCYGGERISGEEGETEIRQHQKVEVLPSIPHLPHLWVFSGFNTYINRVNLLGNCLREVLSWHFQTSMDHSNADPVVEKSAIAAADLYENITAFQKYLSQDLHFVQGAYLSQAKDMEKKASEFFHHQLNIKDQFLLCNYFKKFTKECHRLHKKLK